jgi:hypothetical protein
VRLIQCKKPEQLTDTVSGDIKKMSDEHIRSRLIKQGYDKESVIGIKERNE